MTFLYFIGGIVLLAFAARNAKMALEGNSKIESWISATVCLAISFGLLFAGCSNSSASNDNEPKNGGSYYEDSNTQHPWESDLEQYKENKKPWE
ncbi:hypothetical protein [Cytobacillus firmus]|uniref:hypothetical protein n=1 Tax=Cytobacillus firmus TaxID=1399 RepID=UPI0022284618|nr:hypothetical protein [Cytobacillus firmus]